MNVKTVVLHCQQCHQFAQEVEICKGHKSLGGKRDEKDHRRRKGRRKEGGDICIVNEAKHCRLLQRLNNFPVTF